MEEKGNKENRFGESYIAGKSRIKRNRQRLSTGPFIEQLTRIVGGEL